MNLKWIAAKTAGAWARYFQLEVKQPSFRKRYETKDLWFKYVKEKITAIINTRRWQRCEQSSPAQPLECLSKSIIWRQRHVIDHSCKVQISWVKTLRDPRGGCDVVELPGDQQQFVSHSAQQPVWSPTTTFTTFKVTSVSLSPPFWCSVWTSAGHLQHVCMPGCTEQLNILPNKVAGECTDCLKRGCLTFIRLGLAENSAF